MGRLFSSLLGVPTSTADEWLGLGDAYERGEATDADKARLRQLDREIPAHVQRQIERERGQ